MDQPASCYIFENCYEMSYNWDIYQSPAALFCGIIWDSPGFQILKVICSKLSSFGAGADYFACNNVGTDKNKPGRPVEIHR